MAQQLWCTVAGQAMPVLGAKASWGLNEVGEFSVTVALAQLGLSDPYFQEVKIYNNRFVIAEGYAIAAPDIKYTNGVYQATLTCYDWLGLLVEQRAKSDAQYQDQTVIGILQDLLNTYTSNYELGTFSTMIDPTIRTTVDLRNKETLWAQVVEVCKTVPKLYPRYGGYNNLTGRHSLDIGWFGDRYHPGLSLGQNVTHGGFRKNKPVNKRYKFIVAYSGKVGGEAITMERTALAYPGLLTNAQFPVMQIGNDWGTLNNTLPVGSELRRQFSKIKTANDKEPSDTHRNEVALALWHQCIRTFEEHAPYDSYSITAMLPTIPTIGQDIHFFAYDVIRQYDPVLQQSQNIPAFSVNEWFRITKISLDTEQAQGRDGLTNELEDYIQVDLELTSHGYAEVFDEVVEIIEQLDDNEQNDSSQAISTGVQETQTLNHTGVAADCTQTTGYSGKTFTVPFTGAPTWANVVESTYAVDPPSALVEVIQAPQVSPALPWIGCVAINGGWTTVDDVTITVIFTYR